MRAQYLHTGASVYEKNSSSRSLERQNVRRELLRQAKVGVLVHPRSLPLCIGIKEDVRELAKQ